MQQLWPVLSRGEREGAIDLIKRAGAKADQRTCCTSNFWPTLKSGCVHFGNDRDMIQMPERHKKQATLAECHTRDAKNYPRGPGGRRKKTNRRPLVLTL